MTTQQPAITLQINTAPTDIRFLEKIVPHQIRVLSSQVSAIHITADIRPSIKGRFSFNENQISEFKEILSDLTDRVDKVKVDYVDYSDKMIRDVASKMWNMGNLPIKDYRGGPFYSYIYGLYKVETDYIFHLDSDIFLGGGYQNWCLDAIDLLKDDPTIAIIKPLSGPPKKDRSTPCQFGQKLHPYRDLPAAFYSDNFTTRIFFAEKARLVGILKELTLQKPSIPRSMMGKLQGNPLVKAPEQLLSNYLSSSDFIRLDYLGTAPGLWALHPPFRSEEFYEKLDTIIEAVQNGNIPDAQRGYHDINHAFVDWNSAIEQLPIYRRKKARRRYL